MSSTAAETGSKTHYQSFGTTAYLPDSFSVTELPEWRIAVFTVTYPLDFNFLEGLDQNFVELPQPWENKRSEGVREFVLPEKNGEKWVTPLDLQKDLREVQEELLAQAESSSFRCPKHLSHVAKPLPLSPRVFHERASRRYETVVGESLGVGFGPHPESRAQFHSVAFQELSSHDQAALSPYEYVVLDDDVSGPEWYKDPEVELQPGELDSEFGRVRLDSVQLSEFKDPGAPDQGNKFSYTMNRFLTLTVVAENVSSKGLENISQALNRPRVGMWLSPAGTKVGFKKQQSISRVLFEPVIDLLEPVLLSGKSTTELDPIVVAQLRMRFLNPSNVVQAQAYATAVDEKLGTHSNQALVDTQQQYPTIQAMRTVVAIPQVPVPKPPHIVEVVEKVKANDPRSENSLKLWDDSAVWAWALASGIDAFGDGIPNITEEYPESIQENFLMWDTYVDHSGFAFVRKTNDLELDLKYFQLVQTRYVDLVMLIMRIHSAITKMGVALRELDFTRKALQTNEENEETLQQLNKETKKFRRCQAEFVEFRDRLWFDSIAKYTTDTQVLRALRQESGMDIRYNDLCAELDSRQTIYSSIYESHHAAHQQRENQNQQLLTTMLAVVAVAATLPSFFSVEDPKVNGFIIFLFTGAVMFVIACVYWRRYPPQWLKNLVSGKESNGEH